ncbi:MULTISPECIES: hypothetical protein [Streptomyces]|uniref:hypothetical protein n=1 Tax=Streptomyces TaxID=1883 RepID=UPI0011CD41A0|nr:hypothetical protein [Streptomyces sp. 2132.2]
MVSKPAAGDLLATVTHDVSDWKPVPFDLSATIGSITVPLPPGQAAGHGVEVHGEVAGEVGHVPAGIGEFRAAGCAWGGAADRR